MLFQQRQESQPGRLEISAEAFHGFENRQNPSSRRLPHKQILATFSQDFTDIDLPLYRLLERFGKLIPNAPAMRPERTSGPLPDMNTIDWIDVSLVCFHTLHKIADIKIEWVDVLALHLDFDSRKRTLSIFRYPSFCFLMYTSGAVTINERYDLKII